MPVRPPRPEPPQALHLARLAASTPGEWVALPGGLPRVLALGGKVPGPALTGWVTCLTGEALLDLPRGDFVRLRAAEAYRVAPDQPWTALPVRAGTVLLLLPDGVEARR